jgi:hypothetical protein
MLWIQIECAEATGEQLPRSVRKNLQMAKDCSLLFDEQVILFDVHERNSGQFVCSSRKPAPITTHNDLFFEHFLSFNIVYLSKYHLAYLLL